MLTYNMLNADPNPRSTRTTRDLPSPVSAGGAVERKDFELRTLADVSFRLLLKSKRARNETMARAYAAAVDAMLATRPDYHFNISPGGISWTPKTLPSVPPRPELSSTAVPEPSSIQ
jgi:hypothetical protein